MKKKMVTICLLSLSLVGFAKVGLLFFDAKPLKTQDHKDQANAARLTQTQAKHEILFKGGAWILDEVIPSAEAAKSILLDEEKNVLKKDNIHQDIKEKLNALKDKEEALNEREALIKSAEQRASEKIVALEALETRIETLLKQEESIKNKKIKRLTSVYEGMKADKAAPVIAQMELSIVVKMFLRMNEKQVGKILSFLPPQQAVVISQALTKRIASISQ